MKRLKQHSQELDLRFNSQMQQIDQYKKEIMQRETMLSEMQIENKRLMRTAADKMSADKQVEELSMSMRDFQLKSKLLQQDNLSLKDQIESKTREIELWSKKFE